MKKSTYLKSYAVILLIIIANTLIQLFVELPIFLGTILVLINPLAIVTAIVLALTELITGHSSNSLNIQDAKKPNKLIPITVIVVPVIWVICLIIVLLALSAWKSS